MPITGTVPRYDFSTSPQQSPTVVTVTGAEADGQATGAASDETFQAFLQRGITALSVSGTLSTSGATSGLQCFTTSEVSGVMQFQRELAFRFADIEKLGHPNAPRLAFAQQSLPSGTEVQFGT